MTNQDGAAGPANPPASAAQAPATQTQPQQVASAQGPKFSEEDVSRWKRGYEQWEGSRGLVEAAVKAGYKTPDDLQKAAKIHSTLRERGIDEDAFSLAFTRAKQSREDTPEDAPWKREIERVSQESDKKYRSFFESQHVAAAKGEQKMLSEFARKLAGDNAPEWKVKEATVRLKGWMFDNIGEYPEGHPLRETHPRPYGQDDFERAVKFFAELDAEAKAAEAAAVGDAANKAAGVRTTSAPAGRSGGQGAPVADKGDGRPKQLTREQMLERVERMRAGKQGQPIAT